MQPGLLWLSLFAAVPLVVHLVSRMRPPERRFPTVEFLRRAMHRTFRWRKPQDWLLLALRTLAIAALALCFPQPVWTGPHHLAGSSAEKHLMLVVDRSASMSAGEGGQSRFALACARAVEILRSGGRVDSVNLIWLDGEPDAAFPGMGRSRERIEEILRAAAVSGQRGSAPGALRLALERLQKFAGTKELYIISDFQATNWSEALPAAPADISVYKVKVGTESPNLALSGLAVLPAEPLPGETVQVLARVRNFSPEARLTSVTLTLGDARATRQLEVPAWREAQAAINLAAPGVGEFVVRGSLQGAEDAFAADDTRHAIRRAREGLRAGISTDALSPEEARVWQRALRSLPWVRVEEGTVEDLGNRCEILVAAGGEAMTTQAARKVLSRGGAVIFRPSAAQILPDYQEASQGTTPPGTMETTDTASPWRLKIADEKSPVMLLFSTGEFGDPARGLFQSRARLSENAPGIKGAATLLRYQDGVPAVTKQNLAGGTLWIWNAAVAPLESTWAGEQAFLPFLGEVFLDSRPASKPFTSGEIPPGQTASWNPGRLLESSQVTLRDGKGASLPVREDLHSGNLRYLSLQPLEPGLYQWAVAQENLAEASHVLAHTAVNVSEDEMNLRSLDPNAIPFGNTLPTQKDASLSLAELRDGIALWPWLLALAATALILESLVLFFTRRPAPSLPTA